MTIVKRRAGAGAGQAAARRRAREPGMSSPLLRCLRSKGNGTAGGCVPCRARSRRDGRALRRTRAGAQAGAGVLRRPGQPCRHERRHVPAQPLRAAPLFPSGGGAGGAQCRLRRRSRRWASRPRRACCAPPTASTRTAVRSSRSACCARPRAPAQARGAGLACGATQRARRHAARTLGDHRAGLAPRDRARPVSASARARRASPPGCAAAGEEAAQGLPTLFEHVVAGAA